MRSRSVIYLVAQARAPWLYGGGSGFGGGQSGGRARALDSSTTMKGGERSRKGSGKPLKGSLGQQHQAV